MGNGGRVEWADRLIDPRSELGMAVEQFAEQRSVVRLKRLLQQLVRIAGFEQDVLLELGPTVESVFPRDN